MQGRIHRRGAGVGVGRLAGKQRRKILGVLAPAFEARPVAGSERRHLVEEEQLAIAVAPDRAVAIVEGELAADPLPRRLAARPQRACLVMQTAAAIAHEQSARRAREQMAERIDAVGKRHGIL
ncbi:MAG TPA: hypothetical protein VII24_15765 [Pseudolabrys sp.]|jgi:hypothetical protein